MLDSSDSGLKLIHMIKTLRSPIWLCAILLLVLSACQPQGEPPSPEVPAPSITPTVPPIAAVEAGTRLRLGETLLLDLERDLPGCFTLREVRYSPDGQFFLALPDCFEGDNEAVVFSSDGLVSFRITGQWNKVSYDNIDWAPDSRSLVYQRINSCCAEVPPQAPPAGLVQFHIETQQKQLLLAASAPPGFTYPTSPKWSPDGRWIAYLHGSNAPGSEIRIYEAASAAVWNLGSSSEHPYSLDLTWSSDAASSVQVLHLTSASGSPLGEYLLDLDPQTNPPGIKIQ